MLWSLKRQTKPEGNTMAKYFHLNHGLRGCYMPDGDPQIIMVRTRREYLDAQAENDQ